MPDNNPTLMSGIFFLWNRTADYANKNRCDEQKETKGTKAVEVGEASLFSWLSSVQNLFRAAHELPVWLGPRALAKSSRIRGL